MGFPAYRSADPARPHAWIEANPEQWADQRDAYTPWLNPAHTDPASDRWDGNILRQASYALTYNDPLMASNTLWVLEDLDIAPDDTLANQLLAIAQQPLPEPHEWLALAAATTSITQPELAESIQILAGRVAEPDRLHASIEAALEASGATPATANNVIEQIAADAADTLTDARSTPHATALIIAPQSGERPTVTDRLIAALGDVTAIGPVDARPAHGRDAGIRHVATAPIALLDRVEEIGQSPLPVFLYDTWERPFLHVRSTRTGDPELLAHIAKNAPAGSWLEGMYDAVDASEATPTDVAATLTTRWFASGAALVETCAALSQRRELEAHLIAFLDACATPTATRLPARNLLALASELATGPPELTAAAAELLPHIDDVEHLAYLATTLLTHPA